MKKVNKKIKALSENFNLIEQQMFRLGDRIDELNYPHYRKQFRFDARQFVLISIGITLLSITYKILTF